MSGATTTPSPLAVCLALTQAISRAPTLGDIYDASLTALARGLAVSRSAILLFDPDGEMHFEAWRGLSDAYRTAVEGHSPWRPDSPDAEPIVVSDVTRDPSLASLLPVIVDEGIAAMAFIPLVSGGRVIGKFMLYYDSPRELGEDDLQLAGVIAAQVAFAVSRIRAEDAARLSEERLRLALDAEVTRLADAEKANRQKDDFLGVLSHELRTPLNAIVGWIQMIQKGGLHSREQVEHAIDVIGRNAKLQAQLIEDILDVTRIAAGKVEIDRRPVLIADVLDGVVSALLPLADAKHIQVAQEMPDGIPALQGDAKRLHQALSNVISNAIKFTPEGGRVAVSCTRRDGSIARAVRDSGVGIAPDALPLVFDRFWQGNNHEAPRHGGLGLGLAIARHLIELHGGSISAGSDGLGRGSVFSVTLPILNV